MGFLNAATQNLFLICKVFCCAKVIPHKKKKTTQKFGIAIILLTQIILLILLNVIYTARCMLLKKNKKPKLLFSFVQHTLKVIKLLYVPQNKIYSSSRKKNKPLYSSVNGRIKVMAGTLL